METHTKTAVVLAAGVGSRLRPLTDHQPKALVSLSEGTADAETLLGRSVRLLADYGVEHLIVATGYCEEAVRLALGAAPLKVTLCRNPEYASTQNAVSLALCEAAVAGKSFFKLDGDLVFVRAVLERLDTCPVDLAAAVDSQRPLDAEAMKVRLAADATILEFGKSIALDVAHGESIGIERVGAAAAEKLFSALRSPECRQMYYEDVYSQLITPQAITARAVEVGDLPWTEVDNLEDLRRARELVARVGAG